MKSIPKIAGALLYAIAVSATTLVAHAGPCDVAWDGDKVVAAIAGRPPYLRIPLKDQKQQISEVTVGQIQAFNEAKDRISRVVGRSPSFIICSGSDPNAFATSGANGEVVGVTIGMLKLADSDRDMAAAVLGHEFAHHTQNHRATAESRDAVIGLLAIIAGIALDTKIQRRTGGVTGLGLDFAQLGGTLASRKFSRDQERGADEFGFQYMVTSGFSPNGAVRLADRMTQLGSGGAGWFFDSHPGWSERGDRFRSMIASSSEAQQIVVRAGNYSGATSANNPPRPADTETVAIAPTYTTTDAEKSYSDGIAALRTNNAVTAVQHLRSAAVAEYAPAQAIVGYLYGVGGAGLPKNDSEAVRLFRLAADQGNALGQANLGSMYVTGRGGLAKNDIEAARLYRLAADQGNALGQANLGAMYANGIGGVARNDAEAVRLSRLAADQGNALGQSGLGFMYANGRGGLAKDDAEAVRLYRLAVEQGYDGAQNNLGWMLENGRGGLSTNIEEAVSWYRKAAAQGYPPAIANLRRLGKL